MVISQKAGVPAQYIVPALGAHTLRPYNLTQSRKGAKKGQPDLPASKAILEIVPVTEMSH
jgi:hypothetical protein